LCPFGGLRGPSESPFRGRAHLGTPQGARKSQIAHGRPVTCPRWSRWNLKFDAFRARGRLEHDRRLEVLEGPAGRGFVVAHTYVYPEVRACLRLSMGALCLAHNRDGHAFFVRWWHPKFAWVRGLTGPNRSRFRARAHLGTPQGAPASQIARGRPVSCPQWARWNLKSDGFGRVAHDRRLEVLEGPAGRGFVLARSQVAACAYNRTQVLCLNLRECFFFFFLLISASLSACSKKADRVTRRFV
jgi:hypothetical protein